jgi:hypothetical protein
MPKICTKEKVTLCKQTAMLGRGLTWKCYSQDLTFHNFGTGELFYLNSHNHSIFNLSFIFTRQTACMEWKA